MKKIHKLIIDTIIETILLFLVAVNIGIIFYSIFNIQVGVWTGVISVYIYLLINIK